MRIKVTKEHLIDAADCPSDKLTTNCALALAVYEIFPNSYVGIDMIG